MGNIYTTLENFILREPSMSLFLAAGILLIGYVLMRTAKNCVYAYHIGRNRDKAAGMFTMASLCLYICAGTIVIVIGKKNAQDNIMVTERMLRRNSRTEIGEDYEVSEDYITELIEQMAIASNDDGE